MAPVAEHAQGPALTTIDMAWAWATLQKAATLQRPEQGKTQQIICKRDVKNEAEEDEWKEIRALSSLVFGTAIGLVENADLSEMGKRGIQELMVRGYHVLYSQVPWMIAETFQLAQRSWHLWTRLLHCARLWCRILNN